MLNAVIALSSHVADAAVGNIRPYPDPGMAHDVACPVPAAAGTGDVTDTTHADSTSAEVAMRQRRRGRRCSVTDCIAILPDRSCSDAGIFGRDFEKTLGTRENPVMLLSFELTAAGKALVPFVVVLVVAAVTAVVLWRRRSRAGIEGFDFDEATNYVWANLSREQRTRIAMSHVAVMLEAETSPAAQAIADDDELIAMLDAVARAHGAKPADGDIESVLRLQYSYAERKGVM